MFDFFYTTDPSSSLVTTTAVYIQNSTFASVHYLYEMSDISNTGAEFLNQINTQGAMGYKYLGTHIFAGLSKEIYVKDPSQSDSTFSFQNVPVEDTSTSYLSQINVLGTQGYSFYK